MTDAAVHCAVNHPDRVRITVLYPHLHVRYTHPLLSSCGEVTVHRAVLPVSHGTGSREALRAMGGGEKGVWLLARKSHEQGGS